MALSEQEEMAIRTRVGELLQNLRLMREMSQEDMADYLGIPRSAVSLIESGNRGIDFIEIVEYAAKFRKNIEDILQPAIKSVNKENTLSAKFNDVHFSTASEIQTPAIQQDAPLLYAPIAAVAETCSALGIGLAGHDVKTTPVLQQQTEQASLCRAEIMLEIPTYQANAKEMLQGLVECIVEEYPGSQPSISMNVNGMKGMHCISFLTMP